MDIINQTQWKSTPSLSPSEGEREKHRQIGGVVHVTDYSLILELGSERSFCTTIALPLASSSLQRTGELVPILKPKIPDRNKVFASALDTSLS